MEIKLLELKVSELFAKHTEKQKVDSHPWWDCPDFPPKPEEIQKAIEEGNLKSECNDNDPHLGDRAWHIGRIAYLVKCGRIDLIEMKQPWSELEIYDGGHRLLATWCLGKPAILAYEGQHLASKSA